MTARPCSDKNRYHHGDLRNALILAAAELIEEKGSTEFSMVEASRRAGVSNAAPYRHFRDREDLLEEVAMLGFLGLTQRTRAAAEQCPPGSSERIYRLGQAYIGFIMDHPAFYGLMFGEHSPHTHGDERHQNMGSGFYVLVDAVRGWCEAQDLLDQDPLELSIKLWAMAHGLAVLGMNRQIDKFAANVDTFEMLESATHTFLDGLLSA
jgi:AcrR family transcriptional regulator